MTENTAQYELELPPRASALVESLRDMGYSLKTALADIVDNSITAGAQEIQLFADTHEEIPAIGVLDDGTGMTRDELLDAMRPGTRSPLDTRDATDLGRFGLGLKTASFSQCRRLTVVTRRGEELSAAVWDLDTVAARDKWVVEIPPDAPRGVRWADRLNGNGTLVVWEKLDRLVGAAQGGSGGDLLRQLDEAATHIEFVFHRFLAGRGRIRMSLNDRRLEPFDPFHLSHTSTQIHPDEDMTLAGEPIRIRAVTLPHHRKVTSTEWRRYAGPQGYVANQGFYLYRNRRLIVHGTWFRLARKLELTKLARVAIDIPNTMDAEWKIDVKKASAQPPPPVRRRLKKIVDRLVYPSRETYRVRGTSQVTRNRLPVWTRIQNKNRVSYDISYGHPILQAFRDGLVPDQVRDYDRLLRLVSSSLPIDSLHHDVSANPDAIDAKAIPKGDIRALTADLIQVLQARGLSPDAIAAWMRSGDPFRAQWADIADLFDGLRP